MDDVVLDRGEVEDLGERVANLMRAVVQAEQPDLLLTELRHVGAGQRENRLADLDAELAGDFLDSAGGHFLDPVDDGECPLAFASGP